MATKADLERMRRVAAALIDARDDLAESETEARKLPGTLWRWWVKLDLDGREALANYTRALGEWTKGVALVRDAERRARRLTEMGRRTLATPSGSVPGIIELRFTGAKAPEKPAIWPPGPIRKVEVTGTSEGYLRCPHCGSIRLREYGEAHGEMHYRCRNCGGSISAPL